MTGLTSAMIAYDFDTDQPHRATQPLFYGYIKDGRRGRTFLLMTMISTLHNLSRSLGYAILAVVDLNLALRFFVGEVGAYLLYKLLRRDFYYWVRLEGILIVLMAFFERTLVKVITDFTVSASMRSVRKRVWGQTLIHNLHSTRAGLYPLPSPVRARRGGVLREHDLGANYAFRRTFVLRGREQGAVADSVDG